MTIVPMLHNGLYTPINFFYYCSKMYKVITQFYYLGKNNDWFSYPEVCVSQIAHNVTKTMHI